MSSPYKRQWQYRRQQYKSNCENLLGVNFDYNLKFNEQLDNILRKAGREVNAISRIWPYINLK